jgi:hypothetical protein
VLYQDDETRIFHAGETGGLEGVGVIGCKIIEDNKVLEDFIEKIFCSHDRKDVN